MEDMLTITIRGPDRVPVGFVFYFYICVMLLVRKVFSTASQIDLAEYRRKN